MKIISFYNESWEQEYLKGKLEGHEVQFLTGTMQDHPDLHDDEVEVLSVFIKSKICVEEMDRFPNLKTIVTRSTGFDHINLDEAKKRGITVSNVPFYGENTVAEYAYAMLLTLSRRTYESYKRVLEDGVYSPEGLAGFDLRGKKIGIIGTGHIGQRAIKIARGFGMDVIAYDVREDKDLALKLEFMYVTFEDLLAQSDIISLHAPYNKHTHHMINMDNVKNIKLGVTIINTARGGLIDTHALIYGLENGIISGAGLDVVEDEGIMGNKTELLIQENPDPESMHTLLVNQYLIDHPNVLIMPHNAFNTKEALERILDTTVDNIQNAVKGEPSNLVIKSGSCKD